MAIAIENKLEVRNQVETIGSFLIRYGLVLVIAWIGAMKFTAYEANGIQPLVANSPFLGWIYHFLSVRAFSSCLGVLEIAIALMIALRPFSTKLSALGSALAIQRNAGITFEANFLFADPPG